MFALNDRLAATRTNRSGVFAGIGQPTASDDNDASELPPMGNMEKMLAAFGNPKANERGRQLRRPRGTLDQLLVIVATQTPIYPAVGLHTWMVWDCIFLLRSRATVSLVAYCRCLFRDHAD